MISLCLKPLAVVLAESGSHILEAPRLTTQRTISTAVGEQADATDEIARNVEQAAVGTQEVSSNIEQVSNTVADTDQAAHQVLDVARELGSLSDDLRSEVDRFLADIRAT